MNIKGLKIILSIFVTLSLVVPLSSKPIYATNDGVKEIGKTNQIIVKLKRPTQKTKIGDFKVVENDVGNNSSLVSVEVPEKENVKNVVKEINSREEVEYAEPDYKVKVNSIPNDPLYQRQWFHQVIKSEEAWNITKGSSNVIVAVIDDGIDLEHKDLSSQIVSPYDIYNDTDKYINVGEHGTHVAGIIAASTNNLTGGSGVAPNVKIMPINVFNVDKNGEEGAYISDIIRGIYYAINHGAKIISMSLGEYYKSIALNFAIQDAYERGLVIVAAAGNDHSSDKCYPASYDHVISVASTDFNDKISSYSNYGDSIDISAPGSDILSTLPDDEYGTMSGTSMATPMVSGVAALIWSLHPNFTNYQVINYLLNSTDDLGAYGKDTIFGWGRVNAVKALKLSLLNKPILNSFSDKDNYLNGKVTIKSGQVIVSNGLGVIGRSDLNGTDTFSIKIPGQKAGTILNIQVVESEYKRSAPATLKVLDRTPPQFPVIDEIGDSTSVVKGKAEPLSKISIWIGKTKLGEALADSKGAFSLKITPQKTGSTISIIVSDQSGNKSKPLKITVKDKTAPKLTKVDPVSNLDKTIKGVAETSSTIIIYAGSKKIGVTTVSKNKQFIVKIPKQKQFTRLSIVVIDRADNKSKPFFITVLDRIPPTKPIVYPIYDWNTTVKGKTEALAKVVLKSGKINLGEAKTNSKGYYSVKIKRQQVGTSIYIYAYDKSGNKSGVTTKVR
jgi:subtilisin family serine protease